MRQANRIAADALKMLEERIVPGITTMQMDRWAEEYCRDHGASPAFRGYRGFPGNLCVSVNEVVVHGIASKKVKVAEGDIVSLDFGTLYKGYYGDSAVTVPVGRISDKHRQLLDITRQALELGIRQVQVGNRISDISKAIQNHAEKHGYSVVRDFVGHGIGTSLHEGPEVPNYVQTDKPSPRIVEGMVLAIEPMVNAGTHKVKVLKDGWTVVTSDRKCSAHFEHSVAVTVAGPLVLSRREGEKTV
ncbi:type I methionyl aminopeptidase [Desulfobulbus sp. F4]|nr:type I methionyl aminopeptidase [Desulfobulbus sp. F3]MCW5200294.1 type I methionyl aminopeptidase [Desulfobulbus sp. F4]